MLTHDTAEEVVESDYPEQWQSEGLTFPISYHFEPGAVDDGLTIDVPVATLNRVADDDFSWNVPGLREELVASLIRSLPKKLRVSFVPAPNTAREFLAAVPPGEEPLLDALERYLRGTRGVAVPRDAWDWSKVRRAPAPDVPRARRAGPRAGARQGPRGAQGAASPAVRRGGRGGRGRDHRAPDRPAGRSATIPAEQTWRRAGHEVLGHPALADEGSSVGLVVCGSAGRGGGPAPAGRRPAAAAHAAEARRAHRAGQRGQARPRRLAVQLGGRPGRGLPPGGRAGRGRLPVNSARRGRRTPCSRPSCAGISSSGCARCSSR